MLPLPAAALSTAALDSLHSLQAWAPPRTAAERSVYRSSLRGLLADLFHVALFVAGAPAGTRHPDLGAALEVPPDHQLLFTHDGWARIALVISPHDAVVLAHLASSSRGFLPHPARVPLHVRLSEPEGGGRLALEWRSPKTNGPRPRLHPSEGVCTSAAGPCAISLHLPPLTPSANTTEVVEVLEVAEARRGHAMPRPRQPRRVTVQKIFRRHETVAILRLSGHWLPHLGFTARQSVTVTAEPGKIVLSLASPLRKEEP
jgi:hypothetical protein